MVCSRNHKLYKIAQRSCWDVYQHLTTKDLVEALLELQDQSIYTICVYSVGAGAQRLHGTGSPRNVSSSRICRHQRVYLWLPKPFFRSLHKINEGIGYYLNLTVIAQDNIFPEYFLLHHLHMTQAPVARVLYTQKRRSWWYIRRSWSSLLRSVYLIIYKIAFCSTSTKECTISSSKDHHEEILENLTIFVTNLVTKLRRHHVGKLLSLLIT